jgi:hypothetical protein
MAATLQYCYLPSDVVKRKTLYRFLLVRRKRRVYPCSPTLLTHTHTACPMLALRVQVGWCVGWRAAPLPYLLAPPGAACAKPVLCAFPFCDSVTSHLPCIAGRRSMAPDVARIFNYYSIVPRCRFRFAHYICCAHAPCAP